MRCALCGDDAIKARDTARAMVDPRLVSGLVHVVGAWICFACSASATALIARTVRAACPPGNEPA